MQQIFYTVRINDGAKEVGIIPSQQLLVVRAMQHMSIHFGRYDTFTLPAVKQELSNSGVDCWLSDAAINAIIDVYQFK